MISMESTARVRTAYQPPREVGGVHVYLDPEHVDTYVTICRDTEYGFLVVARRKEDWSGYRCTMARVGRTNTGWQVLRHEGMNWIEVAATRGLLPALNSAVWAVSEHGHGKGWW